MERGRRTRREPPSWKEIRSVFEQAIELNGDERKRFLARTCGDDTELLSEVEALLAVDDADEQSLLPTEISEAAEDIVSDLANDERSRADLEEERTGERLGAFELIRRIGRGGMGSVYLARRVDGEITQQAAVKILRRGLDTDDVLRRFRGEQQILAHLDHPQIARFLDGGRTADGLPYFVLEYVEGRPIDAFCREEPSTPRRIVELLLQVCDAVQSAHQNLVVHCDLKPANVLVTQDARIKLLDFGIAKILRSDWQLTRATRLERRPLTPEYASPEQLRGDVVSTRSDVYSLGVMLVELLSGERPTVSSRPRLSGDLESIAAKALAEDADRRYGTAEQLADDLRRYLSGFPVHARAPTRLYRARRFLRRHVAAVALVSFACLSLLAGSAGTLWQAREAAMQRDRALQAAQRAEQVVGFLSGVFTTAVRRVSAEEMLAAGVARLDDELRNDPETAARIAETLGQVYYSRTELPEAATLFARALSYYRRFPERAEDQARTTIALARALAQQGEHLLGITMMRDALLIQRRIFGDEHLEVAVSISRLSYSVGTIGRAEESLRLRLESLSIRRGLFPEDSPEVMQGKNDVAYALYDVGRCLEAETIHEEILAYRRRRAAAANDPLSHGVAISLSNLSRVRFDRGLRQEGIEMHHRAMEMLREIMPADHISVGRALTNLGRMQSALGRWEEARALFEEALPILEKSVGRKHKTTASAIVALGRIALEQNRLDEAKALLEEGLRAFEETLPADSTPIVWAESSWARLRLVLETSSAQAIAEAQELLRAAEEQYDVLPLTQVPLFDTARDLAFAARMRGDLEAEELWRARAESPICRD